MGQISLRPELVTTGGEACGILLNEQYVGSLTLLYREEDRLWGTVQLDEEVLDADEKEEIDLFLHRYIENMIDALGVPECLVTSTYSVYDHIISTDNVGQIEEIVEVESTDYMDNPDYQELLEDGVEYEFDDDYLDEDDEYPEEFTLGGLRDTGDVDAIEYDERDFEVLYDLGNEYGEDNFDLTIVGESRNQVEYQLFNKRNDLVAEAEITIHRGDVQGEIYWNYEPTDEEIDEVAQIIVMDFDADMVDTFNLMMYYADEEIAQLELTHEDFLDDDEELDLEEDYDPLEQEVLDEMEDIDDEDLYVDVYADEDMNLHFELIRDDVDTLTFDIYEEEGRRDKRLGVVTVDMSGSEITGLVDFVNPRDKVVREQIAYRLIDELDKETDYDTFTITMKYQDEIIDEFVFDATEQPEVYS